jgi:hypothetical protein
MNCRGCALVFLNVSMGGISIVQKRECGAAEYVSMAGRRPRQGVRREQLYVSIAGGRAMQGCGGSGICEHSRRKSSCNECRRQRSYVRAWQNRKE